MADLREEAIRKKQAAGEAVLRRRMEREEEAFREEEERMRRERDRALNESYIGRRIAERDLPETLRGLGMHGGMSESAAVRIRNNYEKSRREIGAGYADGQNALRLRFRETAGEIETKIAAAKMEAEAEILEEQAARAEQLAREARETEAARVRAAGSGPGKTAGAAGSGRAQNSGGGKQGAEPKAGTYEYYEKRAKSALARNGRAAARAYIYLLNELSAEWRKRLLAAVDG